MEKTLTITKKIQIYPVGDSEEVGRVYNFIRNGQYAQFLALNTLMGQVASAFYACGRDLKNEEFSSAKKSILINSNPLLDNIEFASGVDTKSLVVKRVDRDFSKSIKNGLTKGTRTVTNYKRNVPLMTRGRHLKFLHDYEDYVTFSEKLFSGNCDVFIQWVNGIKFKVIMGNLHRSESLRHVIQNIFEETYKIQQSSIQFDETGRKIILNLTLQIPKKEYLLDENTTVGVDLSVVVPAKCSLNNNVNAVESIGSPDEFIRVRTRIQAQQRNLQKALKNTTGGHGRQKKLRALDKFAHRERNFVKTYNHIVSSKVIRFALDNNAKYINLENLCGAVNDAWILRNWSYCELQRDIQYKASIYGIQVRFVERCDRTEEDGDFDISREIAASKNFI